MQHGGAAPCSGLSFVAARRGVRQRGKVPLGTAEHSAWLCGCVSRCRAGKGSDTVQQGWCDAWCDACAVLDANDTQPPCRAWYGCASFRGATPLQDWCVVPREAMEVGSWIIVWRFSSSAGLAPTSKAAANPLHSGGTPAGRRPPGGGKEQYPASKGERAAWAGRHLPTVRPFTSVCLPLSSS